MNVLDDVIILEEIGNSGASTIFNAWNKPKESGGLSWINPMKVNAYQELYQ